MAGPYITDPRRGCGLIGHKLHLCDLADCGEITLEQVKALVRNPKFICKKCGRVTAKLDNLCEPEPLDS